MRPSQNFRLTALIVEDDAEHRVRLSTLLEESDFDVISCESGEAASLVIEHNGGAISFMCTDVHLAGRMDGIELAHLARRRVPNLKIVVTSGNPLVRQLPDGSRFCAKPWMPLDVLRAAQM